MNIIKSELRKIVKSGNIQIGGDAYADLIHHKLDRIDLDVFFDDFDIIGDLIDTRDRPVFIVSSEYNGKQYHLTLGLIGNLLWLYCVNLADEMNSSLKRVVNQQV